VVLALLLLEGVVRLWFDEGPPILLRDAVVGDRYRPSYRELVYSASAGRMVHRSFNRLGYRGPDRPEHKPEGVRRVAVLGDSFTASIALDDAETMPAILERVLNTQAGGRWEVLNFGVDAYSPVQSLLTWRNFARALSPDVVILCFFNGNDVSDDDRRMTNYPRPYYSLGSDGQLVFEPLPPFFSASTHLLDEYSRLYVWQRTRVQAVINRFRNGATRVPGVARYLDSQPTQEIEESWVLTERILTLFADEVHAAGEVFVLVSVPDLVQVRDADWKVALGLVDPAMAPHLRRDYPEQRLAAFAKAHGIPFVPLFEPLRLAAAAGKEVYLPDGHWNEVGTRIGAEVLATKVPALVAAPEGAAVQ